MNGHKNILKTDHERYLRKYFENSEETTPHRAQAVYGLVRSW